MESVLVGSKVPPTKPFRWQSGLKEGWTLTWVSASTLQISVRQEEPSCPLTLLPLASGASSSLYL